MAEAVDQAVLDRIHARGERHYSELRPYEQAARDMADMASAESVDGFAVAADVADKILTAGTVDAVLDAAEGGPGDLADLVGKSFRFIGGQLRWMRSAEKFRSGGFGVYAVFTARLSDGTDVLVSTGAVNVVAQLRALQKPGMGVFGEDGEVSERVFSVACRETANGTLFRLTRG